ncbi:MAG: hypothetical protein IIC10_09575 [Proteobacteria bacterium]|nr:hypothetical protein [Pseudomonadota bacterium]
MTVHFFRHRAAAAVTARTRVARGQIVVAATKLQVRGAELQLGVRDGAEPAVELAEVARLSAARAVVKRAGTQDDWIFFEAADTTFPSQGVLTSFRSAWG